MLQVGKASAERFKGLFRIETPEIATDGTFNLCPGWRATTGGRAAVEHLHQAVEVAQTEELAVLLAIHSEVRRRQAADQRTDEALVKSKKTKEKTDENLRIKGMKHKKKERENVRPCIEPGNSKTTVPYYVNYIIQ